MLTRLLVVATMAAGLLGLTPVASAGSPADKVWKMVDKLQCTLDKDEAKLGKVLDKLDATLNGKGSNPCDKLPAIEDKLEQQERALWDKSHAAVHKVSERLDAMAAAGVDPNLIASAQAAVEAMWNQYRWADSMFWTQAYQIINAACP